MKKYMLLCTIGLMVICADVGKATNASKTEKTLLIVDDHPDYLQALKSFEGTVLVISNNYIDLVTEGVKIFNPPVFLVPVPLESEIDITGSYVPYKQKGFLKPKYHPWYLFNPVKRC